METQILFILVMLICLLCSFGILAYHLNRSRYSQDRVERLTRFYDSRYRRKY